MRPDRGSNEQLLERTVSANGDAAARRLTARRTVVVHTKLAGHVMRVESARAGASGLQVMTMGQVAGRLAGGFIRPIDPEALSDAVRDALANASLGQFEPIKNLPGMVRAAVGTLSKLWGANIDLSESTNPRLEALWTLENEALRRLPPFMKRPKELVTLACARVQHAPAVLGSMEMHGHSEMLPCWRPLLVSLAEAVPVKWMAGPRHVPAWLEGSKIQIRRTDPERPDVELYSCANPYHEVLEAFRWVRELLASGKARPEEIAIAAASPADFDDHVMALSRNANLPIHFVHGVKAVSNRDGQTAAALAETLIKGISQERVRRLYRLLHGVSAVTTGLHRDWVRVLPKDAPLTTIGRWEQAFAQTADIKWPDGVDRSGPILDVLRLLEKGPEAAVRAGDTLLPKEPLNLWRRALKDGPPQALPVTLARLRINDALEPATHVIWSSAITLASAPRPYVRLLALNAGRWPRHLSEDRLIPDHVIPIDELDPLPIVEADQRDFNTIIATARSVGVSYSRRDVEGRLLGGSPLIGDRESIYLSRGRIPKHAASEADRLLARPSEFQQTPIAISGLDCWRDWLRDEITPHDGLLGKSHPRIRRVFSQPVSASSLKLLLRDPIRFVWRYALGWRQPEEADEPIALDGLAFGSLVHCLLQTTVDALEAGNGLAGASPLEIEAAFDQAIGVIGKSWEHEQSVPPPVIWRKTLETAKQISTRGATYSLVPLPGQASWTEIPFGTPDRAGRNDLPWDATQQVEIPGTGLFIRGYIDRLDLSGDKAKARVIDYKTGRLDKNMAAVVIKGGGELQRCLYAFAVKTLLRGKVDVMAALLYLRAEAIEQALFPLCNVDSVLDNLAKTIGLARRNVDNGLAPPGIDAQDIYNDFAFALPASPSYLTRKLPLAQKSLGEAANVWDEP